MDYLRLLTFVISALVFSLVTIVLVSIPNLATEGATLQEKASYLLINSKAKFKNLLPENKKKKIFILISTVVQIALAVWMCFAFPDSTTLYIVRVLALISVMFAAAYVDAVDMIIPNIFIVIGLIFFLIFTIIEAVLLPNDLIINLKDSLITAAIVVVILLVLRLMSGGGIGFGDLKLMLLMGLMQGSANTFQSVFAGLLIIFVVALVMLFSKKINRKDPIPFAPYLLLGVIVSIALTGV